MEKLVIFWQIRLFKSCDTNGLSAVGFSESDAETLAEGTLPQHRVTKLSPRPASKEDLVLLFKNAVRYW
jgi:hydroxyacid-oxoacid transhydrogenase